jgi:hypothetical protein
MGEMFVAVIVVVAFGVLLNQLLLVGEACLPSGAGPGG